MGDFNMAVLRVAPELRSCGHILDTIAWYPWRDERGNPMLDSCAIFMLNKRVEVKLRAGLESLHDNDEDGIGWRRGGGNKYDTFLAEGGPGMRLESYLPKDVCFREKLRPTLTPSKTREELTAAVAAGSAGADRSGGRNHLKVVEKRLDINLYRYQGRQHGGSHFPLCAFTNNVGRRSEERYIARAAKQQGRHPQWRAKDSTPQRQGRYPQWREENHWWTADHGWTEDNQWWTGDSQVVDARPMVEARPMVA